MFTCFYSCCQTVKVLIRFCSVSVGSFRLIAITYHSLLIGIDHVSFCTNRGCCSAWTENTGLLGPVPLTLNHQLILTHLFGAEVFERAFYPTVIRYHSSAEGTLVKFDSVNNWLKECRGYPQVPTKFTVGGTSSCLSLKPCFFCSGLLKLLTLLEYSIFDAAFWIKVRILTLIPQGFTIFIVLFKGSPVSPTPQTDYLTLPCRIIRIHSKENGSYRHHCDRRRIKDVLYQSYPSTNICTTKN